MSEQSGVIIPEMTNDVDIHDTAFALDPFPTYDRLRRDCPAARSERYGGFWLLTRYDDVRKAATDWRTYTSSVVGVTAIPIITQRTAPQLPIELDPPLHSRYRALVNPVFASARIEELRPRVRTIAIELIDALVARGGGDLVADYAVPLSVRTLAAFTGLPEADSDRWVAWIRRMFDVRDRADGARASQEFGAYIDALIAARRHEPCGDFISLLMESEVEGHRLTDGELHSFCTVQFGAGFETTADAMSTSLSYRRRASHRPGSPGGGPTDNLAGGRGVSALRLAHSNLWPQRDAGCRASRPHDRGGRYRGPLLRVGGSRPSGFPRPRALRARLDAKSSYRHLAFGGGPHLCLGAPVARLEMTVTLEEFARRVPQYNVAPNATVEWKTRGDRRGLATCPVVVG